MKDTLEKKLYLRELTASNKCTQHKLYTDRSFVENLDIVNELEGHSGCVNTLTWSPSGNLLASGSDDQHINIYTYQQSVSDKQFVLSTTVSTGHTQNIFSCKFMPHSQDRTIVSVAGDGEVRVFDLEYAGNASAASRASALASEGRRGVRKGTYDGVRYLSDGNTNARVYRSHGDRVKRIVTESSPHLFLTCSEDGEVRQWDLRQPSSAYPAPRGFRFSQDDNVPPPLISYKRYGLDLNSISCSASQPHYIALGGAHLHAFLHDRRMTGRDKLREAGKPITSIGELSIHDQELLRQATQCVRKFAPKGQKRMKRAENGHITALKISDARPDEMVVSWSGDHIYSFDLVRDPGERGDSTSGCMRGKTPTNTTDKKRKRRRDDSETSVAQGANAPSRPRTSSFAVNGGDAALRIRYQNGQSEDIALPQDVEHGTRPILTERQRTAQQIAKATIKIRSALFNVSDSFESTAQFTKALGHAAAILNDVDEVMRDWRYPVDPEPSDVRSQEQLRHVRESTRRFIQTSGTLSRVLGGKLQTSTGTSPMIAQFSAVDTRRTDLELTRGERFAYDFVKAILLWLDSGVGRLIEGFTRPSNMLSSSKAGSRLPIPEEDATIEAIDDLLIPYLLQLANDSPLVNLQANPFEHDNNRILFATEKAAVLAFAAAVRIPFADLSSAMVTTEGEGLPQAQDRRTAHKYWAGKVARGILHNATELLSSALVSQAFGGLANVSQDVTEEEARLHMLYLQSGEEDQEQEMTGVELIDGNGHVVEGVNSGDISAAVHESRHGIIQSIREESSPSEDDSDAIEQDPLIDEDDDIEIIEENEDDEENDDETLSDSSSEADEEDGVPNIGGPRYIYRPALERRRARPKVEADVPCSAPTRQYRGHCNVRTVKDVNYFGPNDEYVVSGSDCGNLFIWDRKTSELVNVLHGDEEVVNVVQGHPYETMLAVSGIDHTVKIFSPDAQARSAARRGKGTAAQDASTFSANAWPMRVGRRVRRERESPADAEEAKVSSEPTLPEDEGEDDDESYVAPTGLRSRKRMEDAYRIMQSNNIEREGGNQDAVITLPHAQLLQLLFGQLGNVAGFQ